MQMTSTKSLQFYYGTSRRKNKLGYTICCHSPSPVLKSSLFIVWKMKYVYISKTPVQNRLIIIQFQNLKYRNIKWQFFWKTLTLFKKWRLLFITAFCAITFKSDMPALGSTGYSCINAVSHAVLHKII